MRLRVEYEKGRKLKYLSHLQLMRLVERTLRRGEIPYALSEGFNPHVKLSLGTVLPVGVWGTAEYFDIELNRDMSPEEFIARMEGASPPGFRVKRVQKIAPSTPSLQAQVNAAAYRLSLSRDVGESKVKAALDGILKEKHLVVPARGKKGKEKDLRPGIFRLEHRRANGNLEIIAVVRVGNGESIRPDELADCLEKQEPALVVTDICRYGNYVKEADVYRSPLGLGKVEL